MNPHTHTHTHGMHCARVSITLPASMRVYRNVCLCQKFKYFSQVKGLSTCYRLALKTCGTRHRSAIVTCKLDNTKHCHITHTALVYGLHSISITGISLSTTLWSSRQAMPDYVILEFTHRPEREIQTLLLWTPLGQENVSSLERCTSLICT